MVAPTKAAVQALSKKMAEYFPDVNAVRVVYDDSKQTEQFDDAKGTTASNENDLQDDIESQAMFRLPRSNITFRALRYEVEPQHDIQTHIDQYIQEMAANNEQLIFTYQPEVVKHANDEPAEEPTVETHDAIAVYLEHKDTDFPTPLQAYKNSETGLSETDQAKYDELVHSLKVSRKAIKVIRGEVVRRAKVLFCTPQLAGSDLVSQQFRRKR